MAVPTPAPPPGPKADDAAESGDDPNFRVRIERERLPDGRAITYYSQVVEGISDDPAGSR